MLWVAPGAVRARLLAAAVGCLALLATFSVLTPIAGAHEDDPKASEPLRPFYGPIWREADGGVAGTTFAASGVTLKAWFPFNNFNEPGQTNTSSSDCWGYVSQTGREYAILGVSNGTAFVEVTDPGASQIVDFIPGPASLWRNVKTYQHYCYSVSEGGGGIQVFDVAGIDSGVITQLPSVLTGGDERTHTMIINETTGYLYRMGGGGNGVRIYDLNPNPAQPLFVAQWADKYTHDGFVHSYTQGPYAGKEIFFACGGLNGGFSNTGVDIIDVTNKTKLQNLSHATYPQASFCHQAWISKDQRHIYINDEIDEQDFGLNSVGRIINVENLSAPFFAGTYTTGLPSVDHNLYVRDDTLYCSNYKTGIQIFDVTDQTNPERIAWFDTYPESDTTGYAGLWSNYPFLPSGTVLGSDIQRGLFVWKIEPPAAAFSYPQGQPTFINPLGGQTLDVQIEALENSTIVPGSEQLLIKIGAAPPMAYPLAPLGRGLYRATFPAIECTTEFTYLFEVTGTNGSVTTDPPGGIEAVAAVGEAVLVSYDMESPAGWTVGVSGDNATSGVWTNVDPNGTSAQPEDDHTPVTTKCWVTGQGPIGGSAGDNDVDNGKTTLISPQLFLAATPDAVVSYWRWYSNNQGGNPNNDSMPVEITNDGGLTWVTLEMVTENAGAWVKRSFSVADFLAPTDNVYIRWVARDEGAGSLIEAGVDDFAVSFLDCPAGVVGDLDGNGAVNGADLAILLGQWGAAGSADFNQDGIVDAQDLAVLLGAWN
ncbi:MAG: choice-of-anchor B family protein [Phycisphaerae bacterium]|nr:choice-of-anchor B family protein [Phycisphaerae bacterium]